MRSTRVQLTGTASDYVNANHLRDVEVIILACFFFWCVFVCLFYLFIYLLHDLFIYTWQDLAKHKFVATQAPVPESFNDFWLMVHQQKTTLIVMLTDLTEKGRVRG